MSALINLSNDLPRNDERARSGKVLDEYINAVKRSCASPMQTRVGVNMHKHNLTAAGLLCIAAIIGCVSATYRYNPER